MNDETPTDGQLVAEGYDAVYAHGPDSPTLQRLWLEHACGPGYPPDFGHISFLTADEARRLAEAANLGEGSTLVDLACGAGGPGLLIARDSGARLVGVDLSPVGVAQAQARSRRVALTERATFRVGSFEATGLPDETADAAMTVDALQYSPDKAGAMAEIVRILRRGGRLVFTAFEVEPERVANYPVLGVDPVLDYTPLLGAAGLSIDAYDETPGWSERLDAAYRAVLDNPETLTAELGENGYAALSLEVSVTLGMRPYRRRVFVVATKP